MTLSYSGLRSYGKATIGNVEGVFSSMNITRDPPRSYTVPYRQRVGDTSAMLDEIGDSGDRTCEAINKFPRGVNPAVDVMYSNFAESGPGGVQAHPPHKILQGGAFRPPVLSQRELLPLSRQSRRATSASARANHFDYSLRPITHTDPKHAREIKTKVLSKRASAAASYTMDGSAVHRDPPRAPMRPANNRISVGAGSGVRTMEVANLDVRTPSGPISERFTVSAGGSYGSRALRNDVNSAGRPLTTHGVRSDGDRVVAGPGHSGYSNTSEGVHGIGDFGGKVVLADSLRVSASAPPSKGYVGSRTVVRTPAQNIGDGGVRTASVPRISLVSAGSRWNGKIPSHALRGEDLLRVTAAARADGGRSHIGSATRVLQPSSGVTEFLKSAARNVVAAVTDVGSSAATSVTAAVGAFKSAAMRSDEDIVRTSASTGRVAPRGGSGIASRAVINPNTVREKPVFLGNVSAGVRREVESNMGQVAHVGEFLQDGNLHTSATAARSIQHDASFSNTGFAPVRSVDVRRSMPATEAMSNRTLSVARPHTTYEKKLPSTIRPGGFFPYQGAPSSVVVPEIPLRRKGPRLSEFRERYV